MRGDLDTEDVVFLVMKDMKSRMIGVDEEGQPQLIPSLRLSHEAATRLYTCQVAL